MILQTRDRFGLYPEKLVADTAYGSAPIFRYSVIATKHANCKRLCPAGGDQRPSYLTFCNASLAYPLVPKNQSFFAASHKLWARQKPGAC